MSKRCRRAAIVHPFRGRILPVDKVPLRFPLNAPVASFLAALFACLPLASAAPGRDKSVWNYDGGIMVLTDGSIPDGPCFRISGRLTAPKFFDNLKRVDTKDGTLFQRGAETVETFPDQLLLAFVVYDHPCSIKMESTTNHGYLTRPLMKSLNLFLYWKRGVELRPIANAQPKFFAIDPVTTHAVGRSENPPEKFVWSYEFAISGAGVPLTDSLVLILREPNGRIAARVAARM
jgi:hypothetical protein